MKDPGLTIELTSDRDELARLGPIAETFAAKYKLPEDVACALHLSLEELVANTICHGCGNDNTHSIRIHMDCVGSEVTVTLEDDGKPFNPLLKADPRIDIPIDARPIGGLGIYFVRQLMDDMNYSHVNGKNRLVMKKRWVGKTSVQRAV